MTATIATLSQNLPVREETFRTGTVERRTYEIVSVLDPNAGPCKVCDKPMARVDVIEHLDRDGRVYDDRLSFVAVHIHADGSAPHNGSIINCVKPQCPQCGQYGTLKTELQAWGDSVTCETPGCDYRAWYSIGD